MKERKLLKQLQRKNEKALEEIMQKYGAYVTTISKEILAGKGTNEDVEEVVSDVFISLWNTAERIDYEKYTSIKAYIISQKIKYVQLKIGIWNFMMM